MFWQNEKHDLAIAQIPKCGITSFYDWLGSDFIIVPNDRVMVTRKVAFIRHPIERVKSAYQFFYWKRVRLGKKYDVVPTESWEEFVDHVLEPAADNAHWRPQVAFTEDVPNLWHKFENLHLYWEHYWPGILDRANMSSKLDTQDYRVDELLLKYADDLRRWEAAT